MQKRGIFLLLAALILSGCSAAGENAKPEAEAAQEAASEDAAGEAKEESTSSEEGKESTSDGSENLGPFSIEIEDGSLALTPFGLEVAVPEGLAGEELRIYAEGYVAEDEGYADIFAVQPGDERETVYVLAELVGSRENLAAQVKAGTLGYAVEELGRNETLQYIGYRFDRILEQTPEALGDITAAMSDEEEARYRELLGFSEELFAGIEVRDLILPEPRPEPGIGDVGLMDLVLSDIDGNEVNLQEIISANELTMLNVWATYCGPCIQEMPELGEMARDLADSGFGIIGLTSDLAGLDRESYGEIYAKAKDIEEQTGVTYPLLVMSPEMLETLQIQAVPTTYFVDSEGKQVGKPYVGSRTKDA